jgi:hypothetical protein
MINSKKNNFQGSYRLEHDNKKMNERVKMKNIYKVSIFGLLETISIH